MAADIGVGIADCQGNFPAYCAEPMPAPRAAIVVIQQIFGINARVRGKCNQWAAAGWLADGRTAEFFARHL